MSTVIKSGQAGTILQRLSTVDLADHLREAHAVVAEAQRRAAQLIDQAEAASVQLREQVRKDGYQAGFAEGVDEGRQTGRREAFEEATERFNREQASAVEVFKHATREIDAMKGDLELHARRDVLELALACARKLTFEIGTLDREAACANLDRAIKLVGCRTDVRIRVNSADVESIRAFAPSVLKQLDDNAHVTIESDDGISPGGCVVETGDSEVDAALETQIDQTVALLLGGGVHRRVAGATMDEDVQRRDAGATGLGGGGSGEGGLGEGGSKEGGSEEGGSGGGGLS